METNAIKTGTYADRQRKVFLKARFDLRMALLFVLLMIVSSFYLETNSIGIYGIQLIYPHLIFLAFSICGLRNRFVEYLFQRAMIIMEQ